MRTNHKLLDLFSGIGGFSLGAKRNGIETIGFVEKDEFCQKILKKHWSVVPIIDDIRKVNGKESNVAYSNYNPSIGFNLCHTLYWI